jgi:hypothetical protein
MLGDWADRIPRDIPQAAAATTQRAQFPLRDDAADEPFAFNSKHFDPPHTRQAPPVVAQDCAFQPDSIHDVLHPWAFHKIRKWLEREENDLRRYAADPAECRRTNTPVVIDQDGFTEAGKGKHWDLRGDKPRLLRRDAPGSISLNASAIRAAAGPAYPDQELLYGIDHGIRMPAEHQMCIVLLPNLISVGGADMHEHHVDVARMETAGILSVHEHLPFIPGVILPQGSVAPAIHTRGDTPPGISGASQQGTPPHERCRRSAIDPHVQHRHGGRSPQRGGTRQTERRQLADAGRAQTAVQPAAERF